MFRKHHRWLVPAALTVAAMVFGPPGFLWLAQTVVGLGVFAVLAFVYDGIVEGVGGGRAGR
jgi:hypothetical protein